MAAHGHGHASCAHGGEHYFTWMYADAGFGETWAWALATINAKRWSYPKVDIGGLREEITTAVGHGTFTRPIYLRYYETFNSSYTTHPEVIRSFEQLTQSIETFCSGHGHDLVPDDGGWRNEADVHAYAGELSSRIYEDAELAVEVGASTAVLGVEQRVFGSGSFGTEEEVVAVVFRGTATFLDWAKNVGCTLEDTDPLWNKYNVSVHKAFWSTLKLCMEWIYGKLANALANPMCGGKRYLMITGHSQGGALAMLLHARLMCELQDGQPRALAVQGLIKNAFCVAVAGPMVFAPGPLTPATPEDTKERFAKLQMFLGTTVTNYIFQDDPVPRSFCEIDVEKAVQELGVFIEAKLRQAKRTSYGLAGVAGVCAFAAPAAGVMVAGSAIVAGAAIGYLQGEQGWIEKKLTDQESFAQFNIIGKQYRHCCCIRLFRSLHDTRPWERFEYGSTGLKHHLCAGYENAIFVNGRTRRYHQISASFDSRVPVASFEQPDQEVDWLSLYNHARDGQFEGLIEHLRHVRRGFIDEIEIKTGNPEFPVKPWHFIHQAAFAGNIDVFLQLMEHGASLLRLTLNGGHTIIQVAGEDGSLWEIEDDEKPNVRAWLDGVFQRAVSYREVGMEDELITRRVLTDLAENGHLAQGDGRYVLPALEPSQRKDMIMDNLAAKGYTDLHLEAVDPERLLAGVSFQEAEQQIKAQFEDASGAARQELAHQFLDKFKFKRFSEASDMLRKHPDLASERPTVEDQQRWSALMQLAYTSGPMNLAKEVLLCYSSSPAVLQSEEDLKEVTSRQDEEKAAGKAAGKGGLACGAARGGERGAASAARGAANAKRLIAVVQMFRRIADANGVPCDGQEVRSLMERALLESRDGLA